MPRSDAYDTSNNQGAGVVGIGPQIVANGALGRWHKVSQGSNFRDRYWPAVRDADEATGLRYRGGYHWLNPGQSVADQFSNFVSWFGDIRPGESIQLDIEDPGGLPDDLVFEAIDRWADRYGIHRLFQYTGRFYMPHPPSGTYLIDRLMARYGDDLQWWLPWYSSVYPASRIPTTPVMWQWAGGAQGDLLQGVGRIDTNEIIDKVRLDIASGYAPGGGGSGPFPQPDPPLDPAEIPGDDDMTILIRNAEPYPEFPEQPWNLADGDLWPADWLFWVLADGCAKRYVNGNIVDALRACPGTLEVALSTGRIQSLPAWSQPTAGAAGPSLTGVQIDSVPGRASALYD